MAQLIMIALFAGVVWFGYRKMVSDAEKLARRREQLRREQESNASGTLVKDAATGVYRVRKAGE